VAAAAGDLAATDVSSSAWSGGDNWSDGSTPQTPHRAAVAGGSTAAVAALGDSFSAGSRSPPLEHCQQQQQQQQQQPALRDDGDAPAAAAAAGPRPAVVPGSCSAPNPLSKMMAVQKGLQVGAGMVGGCCVRL
jgi:hypothetical protein